MKKVRTRFAPSPTGYLHIGGVRTALYAYLYAKKHKGEFILRIEDTDRTRLVDDAIFSLVNSLEKLDLKNDEGLYIEDNKLKSKGEKGPYIQSERLEIYSEYIKKLIENGKAYYCFCSKKRLEEVRERQKEQGMMPKYDGHCRNLTKTEVEAKINAGESYVIRVKLPKNYDYEWEDKVRGKISINSDDTDDKVLIKADGYPTYHFAVVVDDHLMEISHVFRGEEWISSTPIQIALYDAFEWEKPSFAHLPTINGKDGKKLSKRQGDVAVEDFLEKGYTKEGILNYLALVGWAPETNKEIFKINELVKEFSLDRVSKSGGIFDIDKLNWINHQYIKEMDAKDLFKITIPYLKEKYDLKNKDEWLKKLVLLYQNEISFGKEIEDVTSLFFKEEISVSDEDSKFMEEKTIKPMLSILKKEIEEIEDWNIENILEAINKTKEKSGSKGKLLFMPIRIKITGQKHGPELPSTIFLLGKKKVLQRLEK